MPNTINGHIFMQIDLLACFEYWRTVPTFAQQLTTGTTAVKFFNSPVGALSENMATPSVEAPTTPPTPQPMRKPLKYCLATATDRTTGKPATGADQGKMPSSILLAFRAVGF